MKKKRKKNEGLRIIENEPQLRNLPQRLTVMIAMMKELMKSPWDFN